MKREPGWLFGTLEDVPAIQQKGECLHHLVVGIANHLLLGLVHLAYRDSMGLIVHSIFSIEALPADIIGKEHDLITQSKTD